jgi:hypothetical protein
LISRADFIFTIGYEADVAVVDGARKRRYGSLSTEQLAEAGLYKQALCSAVYAEQSEGEAPRPEASAVLQRVLEAYNRQAERKVSSPEQLKRLFGVFEVPAQVSRVMVI